MISCAVEINGSATFGSWQESGSVTLRFGQTAAYAQNCGPWGFEINTLGAQISLALGAEITKDLTDESCRWAVQVVDTQQTALEVNLALPGQSALNSSVFPCIRNHIANRVADIIKQGSVAQPLADAVNSRLATLPESGKLTDRIRFCFPPIGVDIAADGGIRAAVAGIIMFDEKAYSESPLPDMELPPFPSEHDVCFDVSPYMIDSLLWACRQHGEFDRTYDGQSENDPTGFNTRSYRDDLPELFQLAPDEAFELKLTGTGYGAGVHATAPVVDIADTYLLTKDVLAQIDAPVDLYSQLARLMDIRVGSDRDFDELIKQYLSLEQYNQWHAQLMRAAGTKALRCRTGLRATLALPRAGNRVAVFSALLQIVVYGTNFTVTSGNRAFLVFDFTLGEQSVTDVQAVKELHVSPDRYMAWYRSLFRPRIQDYLHGLVDTSQLNGPRVATAPARPSIPLPSMSGLNLRNVQITVLEKVVRVLAEL